MLFKQHPFNKEAYCGPKRDIKTVLFFYLRQTLGCHYLDLYIWVEPRSFGKTPAPLVVLMQMVHSALQETLAWIK